MLAEKTQEIANYLALLEEIAILQREIHTLIDVLDSVGQWIWGVTVAIEPGWEGSQQDVLHMIDEALDRVRV